VAPAFWQSTEDRVAVRVVDGPVGVEFVPDGHEVVEVPVSLPYACGMKTDATPASLRLREAISANLAQVYAVLERYGALNPRVFGSVARGDATSASDVDLLVDLDVGGNPLLRVAGMSEELSTLLGIRVDVVADSLLREPVSATVHADLVAL